MMFQYVVFMLFFSVFMVFALIWGAACWVLNKLGMSNVWAVMNNEVE